MPGNGSSSIIRAAGDHPAKQDPSDGCSPVFTIEEDFAMKRPRCLVSFLTGLVLALGIACPASGQPTLERLEKSIRERTDGEAKPPAAGRQAGYLGLTADDANDRGRGVRVLAVRPGGPAAAAGLKPNDLLTAIAGVRVRQMSDMADIMALFPAGDIIAVDVQRDGKQQQVKVTLAQPPAGKEAVKEPVREATKPPAAAGEPALVLPEEPPVARPELSPPSKIAAPTVEQLQRRIEQLERRVEQLEKTLAATLKKE
jgi:membrane-associated protease RseP (regulator of RpoE activity)